jgi:hypothetical protein
MTNLEQWEKRLVLFFTPSLRIIAEIPISIEDVEEMGQAVKSLIQLQGMTSATNILAKKYPLTMLTLMASYAAYNTQQNYWQSFADFLGVEKNQLDNQSWRHYFVELAKKNKLKVFDFEDSNTPYVTSIRFQGGIPLYSLPDFFERMVMPTVERKGLSEIPSAQALNYMLEHALFVDSPVLNFLRNSGELGVEFFAESRKLVRHSLKNQGEILPYNQVDLPIYVVNAFETYWERREDEQQHWRKPEIGISPYDEVSPFFLLLPEQEIKLEHVTKTIWWQIQSAGQTLIKTCKVFHKGPLLVTNEDFQIIEKPVQEILVSIHTKDGESGQECELRRWKINLLPISGNTPLVAFRDNQRVIPNPISLPAEALYIVHPVNMKLDFDGPAQLVEERIALHGDWKDWVIEFWNLSHAWSLRLLVEEKQTGNVISILGKLELPDLSGGHKFQYQDYTDQPLYTSDLPSLRIPFKKVLGSRPDLFAWKLEIKSIWDTNPQIEESFKLGKYESQIKTEDQWAYFPLSLLLGTQAAGIYQIDIHGPRDIHETFHIRAWPKLLVIGLDSELQASEGDEKPYEFVLRLPPNAGCETQAGMEHVQVIKRFDGFHVRAEPAVNRVKLDLTMLAENEGFVRVPVSFPLPFLQWGLASEANLGAVVLEHTLLHKSLDFLKQNSQAALHVEMYGLSDNINQLRLQLMDQNEGDMLLQEAKFTRTEFTKDWLRVGLSPFSDSIQHIHSSGVFELVYYPADRTKAAVREPLLVLNRELEIKEVGLGQVDELAWKINWKEDYPLKNRRVMLLPAWQPWQTPWEYKIPDTARGEFLLEGIGLPATRYHMYFYVRSSWEATLSAPPENINPFEIDFCSAEERLIALEGSGTSANDCYRNLMEQAVIYDSLGDTQKTGDLVTQAARHLLQLTTLELLLGSLKWIEGSNNILPPFKSYFLKQMLHPQLVKIILERYKINDSAIIEYIRNSSRIKNILPGESAKLLLERVDDPITIQTCLTLLMNKKDEDLPLIIVKLMRAGKLSKDDAFDLLFEDFLWALERLDQFNTGPYVDNLIADLSSLIINIYILNGRSEEFTDVQRMMQWVVRSMPYIENPDDVYSYLTLLFSKNYEDRYLLLINQYKAGRIAEKDVKELLSHQPLETYHILQNYKEPDCWLEWCDYLKKDFPGAFGVIQKGSWLYSPLGKAKVTRIVKDGKGEVETADLDDADLILNLLLEIDHEKFQMLIDFKELEISIVGYREFRKCQHCNYVHLLQDKVLQHSRVHHGVYALNVITFPLLFERDEITFVN